MSSQAIGKTPATASKNWNDMTLTPVTIRMLNHAETSEDGTTKMINNKKLSTVTVVGYVHEVEVSTSFISYTIDDSTGMMKVRQWTNRDSGGEPELYNEGTYVKVIGKVAVFNNNTNMNCYGMVALETFNEISHHLISVVHTHLHNQKHPGTAAATATANTYGTAGTSVGDNFASAAGGDDEIEQYTPVQKTVYQAIRAGQKNNESGVHVPDLMKQCGLSPNDVREAIVFLTNEGAIYDTTSEDWVRTTADD